MNELVDCFANRFKRSISDGKSVDIALAEASQEVNLCFSGMQVYIPNYQKKMRAEKVARITTRSQVQISELTGLSVRQIRRIQRGK